MKLSKRNLLVRYVYLFYDEIPEQTNLCTLFWWFVLTTILVGMIIALFVVGILELGWYFPLMMGSIILVVAAISSAIIFWPKIYRTVVGAWIRDFKNKTCTKVELCD